MILCLMMDISVLSKESEHLISSLVKGRGTACGGGIQLKLIVNSEEVYYSFYSPINYSLLLITLKESPSRLRRQPPLTRGQT